MPNYSQPKESYCQSLFAIAVVLLLTALAAHAQPANNNFANAIPLSGLFVTTTGNNAGATKEPGEPNHGGNSGGHSIWWTWTAVDSGLTTIDTFGSSFDTLLGVYTGTAVDQLTTIASDDDYFNANFGTVQSLVQFNAVAGTVYHIAVDGFGGSSGSITLHIAGPNGVSISSPTDGQVVTFGDPIPFTINISTNFPSPPPRRVDFYLGGLLVGSSSNAPFNTAVTNSPVGTNNYFAVAVGANSQSYTSGTVRVFVQNIGITLLTPVDGSYLDFGSTNPITVTAWAFLPSGSITNIEFFVDGQKFGQDSTPPYSAVWNTVSGGSHRLTAIGASDTGASYNSQPIYIAVYKDVVPFASVWKYLDNGSNQGTNWIAPSFNDSSWASGPAPLGYGDSSGRLPATTNSFGPDPNNKYITTYYRQSVIVTNVAGYSFFEALLQRDDGAVVYVNGTEVARNNMPSGTITYTTLASSTASDDGTSTFGYVPSTALFHEGTNVVAVEIHQDLANSSDIWFQLELVGIPLIIRNFFPTVAITNPTNNAYFLAPPSIPLQAAASDADGRVVKVEFYADGAKVGEATNAPYSSAWTNPPVGPHSLTAIATDDQGARTQSAAVIIIVYDSIGTPYVQITSPADGTAVEGGTNQVVTAFASAQNGVTNVQFLANGSVISDDATSPYSVVWNAPFGTNALTAVAVDANGFRGTSAVVRLIAFPNTTPPTIVTQAPPRGTTITNFTSLAVTFSERVQNVDAGDLLVSGIPATGVTGSGSNYVFTFPQPFYGEVEIAWANGHGITDIGYPSNLPFNELSPDAQWEYTLIDRTPPTILARTPAPGSTVTNLSQITVTFSELVTNVDASDLLVNGTAALSVSGGGANYTFSVLQPAGGTVNVTWAANHGILDLADTPNAFVGTSTNATWSFTFDTRVLLVQSNSTWRFVKGFAEASAPTTAWRQPAFDDSSWSNSQAPFFFGDPYTNYPAGIFGTLLSDMQSNYTTVFLRKPFIVQNRGAITNLLINYQSDDGFIASINGVEVFRYNVPSGELAYTATASAAANEPNNTGAAYIVATLTNSAISRLVNGTNLLTVQALNQSLSDGDFGFNAQVYFFPIDTTLVPPRSVAADPPPGDVFYLTNITISFSEGVSGVDAADLLVNGIPATGVTSTTNATYTFTFPQPPYGPVLITWAANPGITDFDSPPRPFDGTAASATVSYTLLNPSSPRIVTQTPLAGTTITGLTSITLTFTEPVAGVDASDLLINGVPANSVASADNTTFQFSFAQPAFGAVAIRWAANHGITDVETPPAPFDPTRFGGQWNYTLINPVPTAILTSPTNNTFVLAPASVLLRATASDNDGTVALVEFYAGASKLGDATNSPYTLILSNTPASTYVFRAVATDNSGLRGTSAPVVLNVVTSLPVVLVRGPYLQIGTTNSGVVRWRSDLFSDAVVFYGTDPANLSNFARQTMLTNEHIVTITGLQPDTRYFYSIGSSAQRLAGTNGAGSDYWFKTSPPVGTRRPTRFWVLGDSGTANANAASVRDAYYNLAATNGPADFWLMLGDNAYNSGLDTEYQSAVFDFYPATLRNLFLWPAIGNHESNQSFTSEDYPYLNIFSLPHNGEAGGVPSGSQKYYSFDYANIHFTCLDSMTSGRTTNTAMAQWLVNDLAATAQQWLVVYFHHPPYTKGNHNSDVETELIEIRQNILPILEANGVDLVLCGHSHAVERSYLLHGHYGFLAEMANASLKIDGGSGRLDGSGAYRKNSLGQGTVYSVSGSSGQITGGTLNDPANFISVNELGSLVIDVNGGRLDVRCLGINGNSVDYYTIVKEPLPATPISLVARALDGNDVALAWTDLATNEMGFVLERSANGIDFTRFATNTVNTTNASDSGLLANATYFYRVRSFNEGGESNPSAVASVTTVTALAAPTAPSGLAASAGAGAEAYRSQIVLRWRDGSANEAGFLIERSADGSAFSPIGSVAANVTAYVDHNLASATTYYYRVRSFNPVGDSAPSNLSDDQTHPQDDVAVVGDNATFHAGVEGAPPIRYQWSFLGVAIPGATNEALIITNAQPANEGPYAVAVTDAVGATVSNPGWLFVLAPPVIVQNPASRTNIVGSATSFQVVAQGTSPLFYQWRKDGTNLSGGNGAEFDIISVTMADQANYDVLVGNGLGTATSQVARLVVNRPPVAGVDHLDGFLGQTLTTTLAVLLSNDSDADGDALAITGLSSNSIHGATVSLAGQSVTYAPAAGFSGDDSFTYALTDARGASVVGVVTVYLSSNTRPVVRVIPDQAANVLTPLILSNLATDLDVPANKLTYSLDPGGLTNAYLGTNTGVFSFTPRRDQARTTNMFTVRVTNDGRPPLSNSVSFNVSVNDYIEMTAGSVVMYAGDNDSVPLDVYSGLDLLGLQCTVQFNGARLTNFTVENLAPQLATVSLLQSDSNTATLTFTVLPGHTLQGTQHLAQLHFTAPIGQTSAFVPLHLLSLAGTTAVQGLTPSALADDGRVVVVGVQPMVEAIAPVAGQRAIMLYGRKGTNYAIEYSTNLPSIGPWLVRGSISLTTTNFRAVSVGNTVPPPIFYRARQ